MKFRLLVLIILSSYIPLSHASGKNIKAGKKKAAICAGCHGLTGTSIADVYPNLAGQKKAYLINQLNNFKSGSRKNPIMSGIASSLSDDDIENITSYFSSIKP